MSQFDDDDDFDDNDGDNINAIRKAERAQAKRVKELEKELSSFRAESRKRALQSAIEAKGLNPKIAGLVPADADVEVWLEEYGDIFGAAPTSTSEEPPAPVVPAGADAFSEIASGGVPPTGDEGQLMARIQAAKTPEELNQILGIG